MKGVPVIRLLDIGLTQVHEQVAVFMELRIDLADDGLELRAGIGIVCKISWPDRRDDDGKLTSAGPKLSRKLLEFLDTGRVELQRTIPEAAIGNLCLLYTSRCV